MGVGPGLGEKLEGLSKHADPHLFLSGSPRSLPHLPMLPSLTGPATSQRPPACPMNHNGGWSPGIQRLE
jgi:hypothetical protein